MELISPVEFFGYVIGVREARWQEKKANRENAAWLIHWLGRHKGTPPRVDELLGDATPVDREELKRGGR